MSAADSNLEPLSRARKVTGERLSQSLATAPHAFVAVEAEVTRAMHLRSTLGASAPSLTALAARALAVSVEHYPLVNSSIDGDSLRVHRGVHVGVAIDVDHRALVVPVVPNVERRAAADVSASIADLAQRARTRKLTSDDLAGGTISLSNLGPQGAVFSVPIINQPQAAIVSIGRARPRIDLDDATGHLRRTHEVVLGMSFDHRCFDGAYATGFLRAVGDLLESEWVDREADQA